MADAVKAALDFKPGKWFSSTSLICLSLKDVMLVTEQKNIGDIGILLSTDPIACDQAAVGIVYGFALTNKPEDSGNKNIFVESLEMARKIGVGATHYRLQVVRNFMQ